MTFPSLKYHFEPIPVRPMYPSAEWFAARAAERLAAPAPRKGPKPSAKTLFLQQRAIDRKAERATVAAWLDKHGPRLAPARWPVATTLDIVTALPRSVAQHVIKGRLVQDVALWLRRTGRMLVRSGGTATSGALWTRQRMTYQEALALYRGIDTGLKQTLTTSREKANGAIHQRPSRSIAPGPEGLTRRKRRAKAAPMDDLQPTLEDRFLLALLKRDAEVWHSHTERAGNAISPEAVRIIDDGERDFKAGSFSPFEQSYSIGRL